MAKSHRCVHESIYREKEGSYKGCRESYATLGLERPIRALNLWWWGSRWVRGGSGAGQLPRDRHVFVVGSDGGSSSDRSFGGDATWSSGSACSFGSLGSDWRGMAPCCGGCREDGNPQVFGGSDCSDGSHVEGTRPQIFCPWSPGHKWACRGWRSWPCSPRSEVCKIYGTAHARIVRQHGGEEVVQWEHGNDRGDGPTRDPRRSQDWPDDYASSSVNAVLSHHKFTWCSCEWASSSGNTGDGGSAVSCISSRSFGSKARAVRSRRRRSSLRLEFVFRSTDDRRRDCEWWLVFGLKLPIVCLTRGCRSRRWPCSVVSDGGKSSAHCQISGLSGTRDPSDEVLFNRDHGCFSLKNFSVGSEMSFSFQLCTREIRSRSSQLVKDPFLIGGGQHLRSRVTEQLPRSLATAPVAQYRLRWIGLLRSFLLIRFLINLFVMLFAM